MKELKKTYILTIVLSLVPVIAGIVLYPRLPERIVTHWDAAGEPNGWSSKFVGAILLPGMLAALQAAFPFLLRMDPKYENVGDQMKRLLLWILPVTAWICGGSTLCAALGMNVPVKIIVPMFLGLLFIFVGNYLPKTKQSYTVGIKIPWTLQSEENWNRTHRLAGFLWVAAGIVMLIAAWFSFRMKVIFPLMFIVIIIPCVYSYLLFKKGV